MLFRSLVFCAKTALDFRYDAQHRASNLPYFDTKSCIKFKAPYFLFIPENILFVLTIKFPINILQTLFLFNMTTVFPIKLSLSNAFLVQTDKLNFLVDTGSPKEEDKIIAFLKTKSIDLADISFILHTHCHIDHCGSTAALLRKAKIPTIIHQGDAALVRLGQNGEIGHSIGYGAVILKLFLGANYPPFQPDIVLQNEADFAKILPNAFLFHTPGHTAGSVSLYLENNEMIVGDIFRGGYLGGLVQPQVPRFHYFINDYEQIKTSIDKVVSVAAETYYCGHGGAVSGSDLAAFALNMPKKMPF